MHKTRLRPIEEIKPHESYLFIETSGSNQNLPPQDRHARNDQNRERRGLNNFPRLSAITSFFLQEDTQYT